MPSLDQERILRHTTLKRKGVSWMQKKKSRIQILNGKRNLEAFKSKNCNNEVRIEQLKLR
ncbi:MAG: hypothetical protein IPO37_19950 [Saprospiraceae bacterium]|nr:hypothetical protein [Saprospiraceae bacterium]